MVTRQFFPRACTSTSVASASCWLSILVLIQLFRSASSCPYRKKDGLFGNEICNSPWISSQPLKEFAQQQVESSAGFIRHFWGGASLLRHLLDHIRHSFQGRYLVNYFFKKQVSFVNPTHSVSAAATVLIGYWIRVLEAISAVEHNEPGLCAPWTSKNGWYKGHKLQN